MTDGPYRDLRVVVVGAGFAAGAHLPALLQMGCQVTPAVTGHPALRAVVDAGRLGTFTGGSISVPWWRSREYYDEPGRGTYARDGGGVLITQAIHTLDLFLFVVGAPVQVRAQAARVLQPMEAED